MKDGIHPDYKPATIICACGNRVETMSTQEEIHVEICCCLPPVLHRQAEAGGHGWASRSLQEEVREGLQVSPPAGGIPADASTRPLPALSQPTGLPPVAVTP